MARMTDKICVRLGNEQVLVHLSESGLPLRKYAMRIRDGKQLRKLTRDEELVLAAAPGTAAERAAAAARVQLPEFGLPFVLQPRPFLDGEIELVIAQVERSRARPGHGVGTDDLQ